MTYKQKNIKKDSVKLNLGKVPHQLCFPLDESNGASSEKPDDIVDAGRANATAADSRAASATTEKHRLNPVGDQLIKNGAASKTGRDRHEPIDPTGTSTSDRSKESTDDKTDESNDAKAMRDAEKKLEVSEVNHFRSRALQLHYALRSNRSSLQFLSD